MIQLLHEDTNSFAPSTTVTTQGRNTSYESSVLNRRLLQAAAEKSTLPGGNTICFPIFLNMYFKIRSLIWNITVLPPKKLKV